MDITAGGDFLGLCDQKSSYKHVSDFGRLRSYDRLKLRIEGNDYTGQQNLTFFLEHEEKYLILIELLTLNSNV